MQAPAFGWLAVKSTLVALPPFVTDFHHEASCKA